MDYEEEAENYVVDTLSSLKKRIKELEAEIDVRPAKPLMGEARSRLLVAMDNSTHVDDAIEKYKKLKKQIIELEAALDLCGRLRQDDHKKAINELVTTRQCLTGRIKELEIAKTIGIQACDLLKEKIEELEAALQEIIVESGDIEKSKWPTQQQKCFAIAQQALKG